MAFTFLPTIGAALQVDAVIIENVSRMEPPADRSTGGYEVIKLRQQLRLDF